MVNDIGDIIQLVGRKPWQNRFSYRNVVDIVNNSSCIHCNERSEGDLTTSKVFRKWANKELADSTTASTTCTSMWSFIALSSISIWGRSSAFLRRPTRWWNSSTLGNWG
jgi:hypothetical protein